MHFGAEELMRHRATDQRSDVIEKTGKNPHYHQQDGNRPSSHGEDTLATPPARDFFQNGATTTQNPSADKADWRG